MVSVVVGVVEVYEVVVIVEIKACSCIAEVVKIVVYIRSSDNKVEVERILFVFLFKRENILAESKGVA